ncbi:hypothetical protein C8R42DRAFT_441678 [Lentinula raphanica]|nr:hypothetical protein C8R42DRAFT_441678 [Lentinula raphanica]
MTRSTASRVLAILFIAAAMSSGVLAAPTQISTSSSSTHSLSSNEGQVGVQQSPPASSGQGSLSNSQGSLPPSSLENAGTKTDPSQELHGKHDPPKLPDAKTPTEEHERLGVEFNDKIAEVTASKLNEYQKARIRSNIERKYRAKIMNSVYPGTGSPLSGAGTPLAPKPPPTYHLG